MRVAFVSAVILLLTMAPVARGVDPEDRRLPFDGEVYAVARQADGGLLVGGDFKAYRKTPVPCLVRLGRDGKLDLTYGTMGSGWKGIVRALVPWKEGKVLVVGDALSVAGMPPSTILRLNSDGSVDSAFRPGAGLPQRLTRVVSLGGGALLGLSAGILWRLDDAGAARMLAPSLLSSVTDVQAAPGDRLIVALEDEGGWSLQRWTPEGEVDPAFVCALDRAGTRGGPGTFARQLEPRGGKAVVQSLPSSGPTGLGAPSAYLQPGDVLLSIQEVGRPERRLEGVGITEVRALMEGPAGSVATFEIERPGSFGTPAARLRLTIRRRPDTTSARRERPRGRPPEPRTVIAVQSDGKVLVARERGVDAEVIRLLDDGRVDAAFKRVPTPLATNELDARHAHRSVVEDPPESTSPASFTTLFATAWSYQFDPPAVVALAPAVNGRTLAALSDGHVVRLEPDGALDLAFHVHLSGLVRELVPLEDGGAIVVRDYRPPDAPPFAGNWGPKGGVVYVDARGKPVRK